LFKLEELTSDRIIQAYEKTKLKPVNRDWGDGEACGCAITALAIATFPATQVEKYRAILTQSTERDSEFKRFLDLDINHISFINGYDDMAQMKPNTNQSSYAFYERGQEIRKAVIAHFQLKEEGFR